MSYVCIYILYIRMCVCDIASNLQDAYYCILLCTQSAYLPYQTRVPRGAGSSYAPVLNNTSVWLCIIVIIIRPVCLFSCNISQNIGTYNIYYTYLVFIQYSKNPVAYIRFHFEEGFKEINTNCRTYRTRDYDELSMFQMSS